MTDRLKDLLRQAVDLHQKGQLAQAQVLYEQILGMEPEHFDSIHLLGVIANQTKQYRHALELINQAIAISPRKALFYFNRGLALQGLKLYAEAVSSYDEAISIKPDYAEAMSNRGNALKELDQLEAALASYDQALQAQSDYAVAWYNRGLVLHKLKRFEEAVVSYGRAIECKPDFYAAWTDRGNALKDLNLQEAALASYDRAISINPDYADVWFNRGVALQGLGMIDEAIGSHDQAIAINPDFALAYLNKAMALLLKGDFCNGWKLYEWRWKTGDFRLPIRNFSQRLWLGNESIQGRTILLHGEQGYGDTIQFCRYAKLVAAFGARVILEIHQPLLALLGQLEGVAVIVEKGRPLPAFDFHCPLMSLPLAFRTILETIPSERQYLSATPEKVAAWSRRLGPRTMPRIGLAWSGDITHNQDANRSLQLSTLISQLPSGFQYVSLQKEVRDVDRATVASHPEISDYGNELNDFSDTAALCELVDLVISVDTSVAHLAAAMGKATWVLIPFVPDWRWLLDRADTPWYPAMKLYRQDAIGDWAGVLEKISGDLAAFGRLMNRTLSPEEALDQPRDLIRQALALHQMGQLDQARLRYEQILRIQPDHFDSLHLLGVIASQRQNHRLAIELISRAIEIYPHNAAFHYNQAIAFHGLGQFEAAVEAYDKAIAIRADYADAWSNRGNALKDLKQFDAAVASQDQAIRFNPDCAAFHYNRGLALQELNQLEAAVESYNRAIAINPAYTDAYSNRGVALHDLKKFESAIADHDHAISINPYAYEAWSNKGLSLKELNRFEEAVASYDEAIALKPDYAVAFSNRGIALQMLDRLDDALASYDEAIALKPDYAVAYSNRGVALQGLRRLDESLADYDRAIALKPDYADAYWNKSLALLLAGNYSRGWELYEWRWKKEDFPDSERIFARKLWLGDDSIAGKSVLLHSEQGLGDTIQLCRYVKSAAELGARVVLEVQPSLVGLLRQLEGVAELVVKGGEHPEFDCHCPLMSLPLAFRTTLETIPSASKYLSVESFKVTEWSQRLGQKTRPRIGLVWSGETRHKNDRNRSVLLSSLLNTLPPEFEYVSLQKEVRAVDMETILSRSNISHYGEELKDFTDTAALCELMDVVVSVDTSVAHLGGAMGRPTWVMISYSPDWRWLLDRTDSPWYESVRVYRQESVGDWTSVFEDVRRDLVSLFLPQSGAKPLPDQVTGTVDELFRRALSYHQGGRHAEAKVLYAEILEILPDHFDSLQLLGVIALGDRDYLRAVELINQAIILYPCNAEFYFNRGNALYGLNQNEAAIASYDEATRLRPDHSEAWSNRGLSLKNLNQYEAAVASHDRAIAIKPDYSEAYYNRGNALFELHRYDAAVASYDCATGINPGFAEAWANRGLALKELHNHEEAVTSYDRAIAIRPDYGVAYSNRGNALFELHQYETALASYNDAIAINPGLAEAWANRGLALHRLNRLDEARADYDRAIALKPDFPLACLSKSIVLLLSGDYLKGWELYEWRWKTNDFRLPIRNFNRNLWLGSDSIKGKTILLHAEQGFGDTIQFCRYVKPVAALGARVLLEVQRPLIGLLRQLDGVAEFVVKGETLPDFDCHCPLMSLPLAFRTTLETIPSASKYLSVDRGRVRDWSHRLGTKKTPRIGLVWSGDTTHKNDGNRSVLLSSLLNALPSGFQYVSLQKEVRSVDLAKLQSRSDIRHFGDELKDFTDTAALCELMDVVISVDTGIAHLGAALGRPTWVMIPCSPDWRWLLDRTDSPWYESVSLYRQDSIGDWTSVFERVRADLISLLQKQGMR
ncbi:MAG: tetratricopeptide repeat protein [Chlorobiaceae bacterium]|nr:tetratricopeptide repeat protein [Chlorobiaceae bacterium]